MTITVARKAINLKKRLIEWNIVRGEMPLLGTVLPVRGVRSGHSNDYLTSSSLLSIAVGLERLHLAASYFFLEVRGQIPPVPHRSTARSNGSKHRDIMLHYAEWARHFCWAVALMMYQCFTDSHSIKRSYTVGIQHWCLCFLSAWNLKCP